MSSLAVLLLLGGCATFGLKDCSNDGGRRKPPSTKVDTERLTTAIKKSVSNQDAIIKDGESLERELPEDARPANIVEKANDTKVELGKADQTVVDLIAKAAATDKIVADKDAKIEEQAATIEKQQAELDSSSAWIFGLMIVIGAIGIPVSIAVMVKIDKTIGSFGLIVAVGSVVTGYFLKEFAVWIPLIGAVCAAVGGVMFWRQHTKDQEKHVENEEAVRELVATTALVQKKGWNQETHDHLSDMISEPTRAKVKAAREKHKIARVDLPPIPLTA
jgi:hypothetical protein